MDKFKTLVAEVNAIKAQHGKAALGDAKRALARLKSVDEKAYDALIRKPAP